MSHGEAIRLEAGPETVIAADSPLTKLPKLLGVVGIICLIAGAGLAAATEMKQFYFSYLTAYAYFLSLALGGLFFVIVQFMVKAGWSVLVRRVAENLMGTLPLFALLFIPVLIGLHDTHHHWWHYEVGSGDALLDHKASYLNPPFFIGRAALYLGLWSYLAWTMRKLSIEQDRTGDEQLTRRLQRIAPPALIIFALTLTFAAIDWLKTMDPHWYSTMWGVYYFAGAVVSFFAVQAVLLAWFQKKGHLQTLINAEHYHDIGKLLFGFVVFWSYIAFSQYFLIWYANIPEETLWYQHRSHGSWGTIGVGLIVGHFFIPFFFLLPRGVKRNKAALVGAALWVLFVHYIDLYWQVMPILHEHGASLKALPVDLLAFAGVGALFLAAYVHLSTRAALVPLKDPRMPESVAFENF